jgi:hypothetical protein
LEAVARRVRTGRVGAFTGLHPVLVPLLFLVLATVVIIIVVAFVCSQCFAFGGFALAQFLVAFKGTRPIRPAG